MNTLIDAFLKTVSQHPKHGLYDESSFYSFELLHRHSNQLASGLLEQGIPSGAVIGVAIENCIELVLVHLAILKIGGIALPLNPGYTNHELSYLLQDSKASAVFSSNCSKEKIETLKRDCPCLKRWIDVFDDVPTFKSLFVDAPVLENTGHAEDTAYICYTSGTTGHPKGACLSHHNILFNVHTLLSCWKVTAKDRFLLTLPMFHVHGLMLGLFGSFLFGHTTWICKGFDAKKVLSKIISHQITLFMGVPTMYHRLAACEELSSVRESPMRLFTSGSAPLSADLFERFYQKTGHQIIERYGLTETLINTTNPYEGPRIPGKVGHALPNIQLELRNDADQPIAVGNIGEVWIKGPNVFKGYLNRPEANAQSFYENWFRTGDLARLDDEGVLEIVGRKKELIITGGYNVYPNEVEEVLVQMPEIQECAVIGKPDSDFGEAVHAVIVEAPGASLSLEQLQNFCKQYLTSYKIPKHLMRMKALPRNAMGKVQKHQLQVMP
ncbi:AMP-binding protein [Deltaproteobacteria bacterium TL4]